MLSSSRIVAATSTQVCVQILWDELLLSAQKRQNMPECEFPWIQGGSLKHRRYANHQKEDMASNQIVCLPVRDVSSASD